MKFDRNKIGYKLGLLCFNLILKRTVYNSKDRSNGNSIVMHINRVYCGGLYPYLIWVQNSVFHGSNVAGSFTDNSTRSAATQPELSTLMFDTNLKHSFEWRIWIRRAPYQILFKF